MDGAHPAHDAMVAKGGDLAGGERETVTADLKPGKYELICHMAGHYAAGQHMPFTVNGMCWPAA
jgi:uncharacterized cupredoxin-like copper-binding protein